MRVHLDKHEIRFITELLDHRVNHDGPDTDGYISATDDPESALLNETQIDNLLHRLRLYAE